MVITDELRLDTRGDCDIVDITSHVRKNVESSSLRHGTVTIFCPGSTGGLTTIEYESGAVHDLQQALDRIAPPDGQYRHHLRWGDDNGHSHVRSALVGPSLTVPVVDGALTLGNWQQIVFLDFDTRPRSRRLVVQIMGQ